jgi:hypothetical protein
LITSRDSVRGAPRRLKRAIIALASGGNVEDFQNACEEAGEERIEHINLEFGDGNEVEPMLPESAAGRENVTTKPRGHASEIQIPIIFSNFPQALIEFCAESDAEEDFQGLDAVKVIRRMR